MQNQVPLPQCSASQMLSCEVCCRVFIQKAAKWGEGDRFQIHIPKGKGLGFIYGIKNKVAGWSVVWRVWGKVIGDKKKAGLIVIPCRRNWATVIFTGLAFRKWSHGRIWGWSLGPSDVKRSVRGHSCIPSVRVGGPIQS